MGKDSVPDVAHLVGTAQPFGYFEVRTVCTHIGATLCKRISRSRLDSAEPLQLLVHVCRYSLFVFK
jgi:hypothetical protein